MRALARVARTSLFVLCACTRSESGAAPGQANTSSTPPPANAASGSVAGSGPTGNGWAAASPDAAGTLAEPAARRSPAPLQPTGVVRFLAIGGGPTPESNEVSLEQDIDLVRRSLPEPGVVLFAGGSNAESVRELDPTPKGDPVRTALGELFAPRSGRQSRYRTPRFAAERATLENVEAALVHALSQDGPPLLIHVAAHGDQGPDARNNMVALWGGRALSVAHLAELHERYTRGLRIVATSCFSGGFAELAFAHADAKTGQPSAVPRCGLFAGTWDRETSGCDPNPDRRAQESYGLHFVHALSGKRKDGAALELAAADFDGDGKIGLLDAHTWASIEAVSFDVPTTTSERWLRQQHTGSAPIDARLLPEAAALTRQLGNALGLKDERAVARRWDELTAQINELGLAIDRADEELATRDADHATLLLEQWPVIDDPYHPDFEPTFETHRRAIESTLTSSPEAHARAQTNARATGLYNQLHVLQLEEARVLRVHLAYETLHRAAALLKRGGPAAKYYASLLACERAAP
ncbi:MAG: hypothetical protein RL685_2877 [Pseudomonadota bacterium]|jgi:hypothetical protein